MTNYRKFATAFRAQMALESISGLKTAVYGLCYDTLGSNHEVSAILVSKCRAPI